MNMTFDIGIAMDYSRARTRLGLSLIPIRPNEEMLSRALYTEIEDLALIYKVELGPRDSIIIDKDILGGYGICFEQLRDDALRSAGLRHPCVIRSLIESLRDLTDDEEEDIFSAPSGDASGKDSLRSVVYTATTEDMCMGACVIAYPGVLERAAQMIGGDYYILPSSVHEVLFVMAEGADCRRLKEMVCEINRSVVDKRDRLSDNVYYYESGSGTFMTAGML